MPKKKTNFETDIARLADIVAEVEDEDTSLDNAIKLYKEGLALAASCGKILTVFETEIVTLQKDAEDNFALKPFEYEG